MGPENSDPLRGSPRLSKTFDKRGGMKKSPLQRNVFRREDSKRVDELRLEEQK